MLIKCVKMIVNTDNITVFAPMPEDPNLAGFILKNGKAGTCPIEEYEQFCRECNNLSARSVNSGTAGFDK